MILIDKTFELITPESAEHGEPAEAGFLFEAQPYTFRGLVRLLQEHPYPSCSSLHAPDITPWIWFSSHAEPDYRTGAERTTSIHFSHRNKRRALRYWRLALRAAGYLKG